MDSSVVKPTMFDVVGLGADAAGSDPTASSETRQMLYFDLKPTRMAPLLACGSDHPEHESARPARLGMHRPQQDVPDLFSQVEQAGELLTRKAVGGLGFGAAVGVQPDNPQQPRAEVSEFAMHFVSLEFKDEMLEAEYLTDNMRRSKRWVQWWVFVSAAGLAFVGILHSMVLEKKRGEPPEMALMYYSRASCYALQWLQMKICRDFVQKHFQTVQFFWCIVQATALLIFVCYVGPQAWRQCLEPPYNNTNCGEERFNRDLRKEVNDIILATKGQEDIITLVFTTMIFFRMRFIYYLFFVAYIAMGYMYCRIELESYGMRYFHIMNVSLVIVSYTFDWMSRRDFVQATMVWKEGRRSDLLLHNILPAVIVDQLKAAGGRPISESFDMVTILFADVVSFTTMSAQISPAVLVDLLNKMFFKIDTLAEENGVEKIKTIGDCYMAAAGLPLHNPTHAQTMARFALAMRDLIVSGVLRNPARDEESIRIRIGIHSGPCVAGVIGHKKFAYDVWGDTVNTASRMESHGEPMKVHCSADSYELIHDDFECEARPRMTIKGKGEMQTFFIVRERLGESGPRKSFVQEDWFRQSVPDILEEREDEDDESSLVVMGRGTDAPHQADGTSSRATRRVHQSARSASSPSSSRKSALRSDFGASRPSARVSFQPSTHRATIAEDEVCSFSTAYEGRSFTNRVSNVLANGVRKSIAVAASLTREIVNAQDDVDVEDFYTPRG